MSGKETVVQSDRDRWYTRPVFAVADIQQSLQHYCGLLGFTQDWRHDEDGRTTVIQVNKGAFELILAENLDNVGASRVYVSLAAEEMQRLERGIEDKKMSVKRVFWGYDLIQICDPDGNRVLVSAAC